MCFVRTSKEAIEIGWGRNSGEIVDLGPRFTKSKVLIITVALLKNLERIKRDRRPVLAASYKHQGNIQTVHNWQPTTRLEIAEVFATFKHSLLRLMNSSLLGLINNKEAGR